MPNEQRIFQQKRALFRAVQRFRNQHTMPASNTMLQRAMRPAHLPFSYRLRGNCSMHKPPENRTSAKNGPATAKTLQGRNKTSALEPENNRQSTMLSEKSLMYVICRQKHLYTHYQQAFELGKRQRKFTISRKHLVKSHT